jgi:hypothetical protein
MEKSELKSEIDILIESIKKQADRMNTQDNLSAVELEVLHHKIQKLYEKSILIHHLPSEQSKVTSEIPRTIAPPEVKKEEPLQAPVPAAAAPERELLQTPEPIAAKPASAADLFGGSLQPEVKPFGKPKTEKEAKSIGGLRKPILDLQKSISINDKFRFINELFEGNSTEFNVALNQINSCPAFEEADRYVSNVKRIYQWKDDSEAVSIFLDLVERRFL